MSNESKKEEQKIDAKVEQKQGAPFTDAFKGTVGKGLGCVALVIIVIVAFAALGSGNNKQQTQQTKEGATQSPVEKEYRFKDRPDTQPNDVELLVGESAELGGIKVTFTNVSRTTILSEFEQADQGKEFVIMSVALENTSDRTESYNELNFRIQTAGGQVLDSYLFGGDDSLHSGDLVTGGKHSGTVTFEVSKEDGHQYVIYKPNPFEADRIVVQIQ